MTNLDELKLIEEIDRSGMREIISNFPEHIQQAFKLGEDFSLPAEYGSVGEIVFCGMGGSAIGAELISAYLRDRIKASIYINRDYNLPAYVDQNTLVILVADHGARNPGNSPVYALEKFRINTGLDLSLRERGNENILTIN